MELCTGCSTQEHAPDDCDNRNKPMITRTCPCDCDRAHASNSPYWDDVSSRNVEATS